MTYVPVLKPQTGSAVLSASSGTQAAGTGASTVRMKLWACNIQAYTRLQETTGDGDSQYQTSYEQADLSYLNISLQGAFASGTGAEGADLTKLHTQNQDIYLLLDLGTGFVTQEYKVLLERIVMEYDYRAASIKVSVAMRATDNLLSAIT